MKIEEQNLNNPQKPQLNIPDVISRLFSEVENEFKVKGVLFMTYRKESDVLEFYEVDENEEKVEKELRISDVRDMFCFNCMKWIGDKDKCPECGSEELGWDNTY